MRRVRLINTLSWAFLESDSHAWKAQADKSRNRTKIRSDKPTNMIAIIGMVRGSTILDSAMITNSKRIPVARVIARPLPQYT
jgi:hypothetical protein